MKERITLEQIKEWVKNKQFDKFYRSEEIQKKYDSERDQTIKELKKTLEEIIDRNRNRRWILRKNDYPYYFEEGLEHWVLWDKTICFDPWMAVEISWNNYKHYEFKEKDGWVANWINPPKFRSVNNIPHVHLVKISKPYEK